VPAAVDCDIRHPRERTAAGAACDGLGGDAAVAAAQLHELSGARVAAKDGEPC
jgi:hypothetical protein